MRVCVAACLRGRVCTTKTADRNDLKLSIVVVLGTLPQPTDYRFRRARARGGAGTIPTRT